MSSFNSSLSSFMVSLLEDSVEQKSDSNFVESSKSSLNYQSTNRKNANGPDSVVVATDSNDDRSSSERHYNTNGSSQQSIDLERTAMAKDESLPKSVRDAIKVGMSSDRKQLKRRRMSLAARFHAPSKESGDEKKTTQDDISIGLSSLNSDNSPVDGLSCKCVATEFSASLSTFMTQLLSESGSYKLKAADDRSASQSGEGGSELESAPMTQQQQQKEKAQSQGERGKMNIKEGVPPRNSEFFAAAMESLRRSLSEQDIVEDNTFQGKLASYPGNKLRREDLPIKNTVQPAVLTSDEQSKERGSSDDGSSSSDWSALISEDQSTNKGCAEDPPLGYALKRRSDNISDGFLLVQQTMSQSASSILQCDNAKERPAWRSSKGESNGKVQMKRNSYSSIPSLYNQDNDSQCANMLSLAGLGTKLEKSESVCSLRQEMVRLPSSSHIYTHSIDGDNKDDDSDSNDDEEPQPVGDSVDIDTVSQMEGISRRTKDLHKSFNSGIDTNIDIDTVDFYKSYKSGIDTNVDIDTVDFHKSCKSGIDTNVDIDVKDLQKSYKSGIDIDVDIDVEECGQQRRNRSITPQNRREKADNYKRCGRSTSCAASGRSMPSVDLETGMVSQGTSRSPADKKRNSSSKSRGRTPSSRKERHGSVRGDSNYTSSQRTKTPSSRKSRSTAKSPTARSPSRSTRKYSRSESKTPSRSARTSSRDETKTPSRRHRSSRDEPKTPSSRLNRSTDQSKTPSRRQRSSSRTPSSRRQRSSVRRADEGHSRSTTNKRDKSRSRRDGRTSTSKSGESKRDLSRSSRKHRSTTNEDSDAILTRHANGTTDRVSDAHPSRGSSRSHRTSRSTLNRSPSTRGMRRSTTEPSVQTQKERTGNLSTRGKRSSNTNPATPSCNEDSVSPSAHGREKSIRDTTRTSLNKRSGSPSAREMRRSVTEPTSPSHSKRRRSPSIRGNPSSNRNQMTQALNKQPSSPSARGKRSSRSPTTTSLNKRPSSPSARGKRSIRDSTIPSLNKSTGSPSARGERSSNRDQERPLPNNHSGSPSARGKRSSNRDPTGAAGKNKDSGSPSARGKRSSLAKPNACSTRKTKESSERSRRHRMPRESTQESNPSSDVMPPTSRTCTDDGREGRASHNGNLSNCNPESALGKTDESLLLFSKPHSIRRTQTDSNPLMPVAKPTLRRFSTTGSVPTIPKQAFLRPPENDTNSIFFFEMDSTSTRETSNVSRVRRASLGGGSSDNLGASSSERQSLRNAAPTQAALLVEAVALATRQKKPEREARPDRRGARRRSMAQAQEVLRQSLIKDMNSQENVENPLMGGMEALGSKEEAWLTRRKKRMVGNVAQEVKKPL